MLIHTTAAQSEWEDEVRLFLLGYTRPSCKKDFKINDINSYSAIISVFLDS